MKLVSRLLPVLFGLVVGACAHTPPVSMHYHYARADLSFKVTRTVACDEANFPVIANAVTPTIRYSADRSAGTVELSAAKLRGPLSDSDLKFEFHEDGRLKGINATTTGQGEIILKSAFTFFGAILGTDYATEPTPTLCTKIKSWNGGKPVTLFYEGDLDPARKIGSPIDLKPDLASAFYAGELKEAIGGVCARVTAVDPAVVPVQYTRHDGDVVLWLKQPALAQVGVNAGAGEGCGPTIWSGAVAAGQIGTSYMLPIPQAAAFGKQAFAVTVNDSGSLGSIQYAHINGSSQSFNAATAGFDLVNGQTDAQKAAQLKAEADLIAAQQRLVACRTNPQECK